MFEWVNLSILISSLVLFSLLYTLSTMPITLSEKFGQKAWKICSILRVFAMIFEFISLATLIIWIWFPIEKLAWKISSHWWIGLFIASLILIPGAIVMTIGMKDAGKETASPSEETEMYGGIYKYIRHPQTLGEMPMFVAIAFAVNSWFLVIVTFAYIIIYIPIMLYFEEKDLVKRFGESYKQYQKETGILFPKIKS